VTSVGGTTSIDQIFSTSTTAFGGADTISTGDGSDIVIGGRADDTIDAGNGDNIVIGDSGQITGGTGNPPQLPGQPITLGEIQSTQLGDGGSDTIVTGSGSDIVLGGAGGDTISGGAGSDVVFGDNGQVNFTSGVITQAGTTDTTPGTGGNDTI